VAAWIRRSSTTIPAANARTWRRQRSSAAEPRDGGAPCGAVAVEPFPPHDASPDVAVTASVTSRQTRIAVNLTAAGIVSAIPARASRAKRCTNSSDLAPLRGPAARRRSWLYGARTAQPCGLWIYLYKPRASCRLRLFLYNHCECTKKNFIAILRANSIDE
jgi:hypothetical protein